jgi:hypothetical protein
MIKTLLLWDWFDFGLMLRVFKNAIHTKHKVSIDIQIGWLNIWIQIIRRDEIRSRK